MTNDKKTCPTCNEEKPRVEFSTISRRQFDIKFIESNYCATCYLMQLVTHYPSYRIENGKCIVDYVPYPTPRMEYIIEMQQILPARLADEDVQRVFGALGSLEDQARPFEEFVRALA